MKNREPIRARPYVRGMLIVFAMGLIAIFMIAMMLNPYDGNGKPLRMGTHEKLGLAPCEFATHFGKPCPSCGLTTSFTLLMHGDIWNSFRANAIGPFMALTALAMIPWSLLIAVRGRYYWVRSMERTSLYVVGLFTVLLLVRWGIVLLFWHK